MLRLILSVVLSSLPLAVAVLPTTAHGAPPPPSETAAAEAAGSEADPDTPEERASFDDA